MDHDDFVNVVGAQQQRCEDVLVKKQGEYAGPVDVLHNFKSAARLHSGSQRSALAGMMAKHTVSIYDMCASDEDFPLEVWDEKITDHMNYLLLLACIVQEESTREVPLSRYQQIHQRRSTTDA
jgi:hypothetical protein